MKEWKLIRKTDGYVSMIYYQEDQPEFNQSFGNEPDFEWESKDINLDEYNLIKAEKFKAELSSFVIDFIESYFEKEKELKPAKMNQLLQKLAEVKASIV